MVPGCFRLREGAVAIVTKESESNLRWAGDALTTHGTARSRRVVAGACVGASHGDLDGGLLGPHTGAAAEFAAAGGRGHQLYGYAEDLRPPPSSRPPQEFAGAATGVCCHVEMTARSDDGRPSAWRTAAVISAGRRSPRCAAGWSGGCGGVVGGYRCRRAGTRPCSRRRPSPIC